VLWWRQVLQLNFASHKVKAVSAASEESWWKNIGSGLITGVTDGEGRLILVFSLVFLWRSYRLDENEEKVLNLRRVDENYCQIAESANA
jgi:hypothetical protein